MGFLKLLNNKKKIFEKNLDKYIFISSLLLLKHYTFVLFFYLVLRKTLKINYFLCRKWDFFNCAPFSLIIEKTTDR